MGFFGDMFAGSGGGFLSTAANMYMANEEQNWRESMMKQAHQFEVADLRKAGLNPVLSAGGKGASAPSPTPLPDTSGLRDLGKSSAFRLANEQVRAQRIANESAQIDLDRKRDTVNASGVEPGTKTAQVINSLPPYVQGIARSGASFLSNIGTKLGNAIGNYEGGSYDKQIDAAKKQIRESADSVKSSVKRKAVTTPQGKNSAKSVRSAPMTEQEEATWDNYIEELVKEANAQVDANLKNMKAAKRSKPHPITYHPY